MRNNNGRQNRRRKTLSPEKALSLLQEPSFLDTPSPPMKRAINQEKDSTSVYYPFHSEDENSKLACLGLEKDPFLEGNTPINNGHDKENITHTATTNMDNRRLQHTLTLGLGKNKNSHGKKSLVEKVSVPIKSVTVTDL